MSPDLLAAFLAGNLQGTLQAALGRLAAEKVLYRDCSLCQLSYK